MRGRVAEAMENDKREVAVPESVLGVKGLPEEFCAQPVQQRRSLCFLIVTVSYVPPLRFDLECGNERITCQL